MPSQELPAQAGQSVELFLAAVDNLAPGLVSGFYLTGTMTSKSGAGRHAQRVFGPRWQPIIAESLYLCTGGGEGHRGHCSPLARRRDTLAFLDTAIEAALALPSKS